MNNIYTQIDTPRLRLKILELADAKAVQHLLATNKQYMLPYISWAKNEPQSVTEKENKIREWKSDFYRGNKYIYGVFNRLENKLVGLFFLFTRQGEDILEIGYVIDYQQTGKAYATEGCYALTKLCFEKIEIEKVVIICSMNNIASAKIPKKLGYTMEYTLRNIHKDGDGNRHEDMVWVMFIEEFKHLEKYEPTTFTD